jgi:hypothetical protein
MIYKILNKIISVIILAIISGCIEHHVSEIRNQMGREDFLANQTVRYDHYYASPHSVVIMVIACLFLIGFYLVAYEFIALVVLKLLVKINEPPV